MSPKRPHPHFDDRGTLDWETRYAAALATARSERRILLVELGREACGQCRALVQSVVPRPDVAPLLQERFVALAADADDTEAEVEELAMNLEDATMLPFVLFADADGKFLDGLSGHVNPAVFVATLKRLAGAS
jgi:thioredoxin-related protein